MIAISSKTHPTVWRNFCNVYLPKPYMRITTRIRDEVAKHGFRYRYTDYQGTWDYWIESDSEDLLEFILTWS